MGPRSRFSQAAKRLLPLGVAGLVTLGALLLSHLLVSETEQVRGVLLAKQVMAQVLRAESVEDGVFKINTTSAKRVIRAAVITVRDANWQGVEGTKYIGGDHGEFVYWRWVKPERPEGVSLTIDLGYRGFLGTTSRFAEDIALFVFALFVGAFTALALRPATERIGIVAEPLLDSIGGVRETAPDPLPPDMLRNLAGALRSVLKETKKIAIGANRSRGAAQALVTRLEEELLILPPEDPLRPVFADLLAGSKDILSPQADLFATARALNEWTAKTLEAMRVLEERRKTSDPLSRWAA